MLTTAELQALFAAAGAPTQEGLLSAMPSSQFPLARFQALINDPLVDAYFKKLLLKLRECRSPIAAASSSSSSSSLIPINSADPSSSTPQSSPLKAASIPLPMSPGPQSTPLKAARIPLPMSPGPQSSPLKSPGFMSPGPKLAAPPTTPTRKSQGKSQAPRTPSPKKSVFSLSSARKVQPVEKLPRPPRVPGGAFTSHPVDPYIIIKLMIRKLSAEGVVKEAVKGLLEEDCKLKLVVGLDADIPGKTHWERDYCVWFVIMVVENQVNGGIFKGLGGKDGAWGGAKEEVEEKVEGVAWLVWGILKFMIWSKE